MKNLLGSVAAVACFGLIALESSAQAPQDLAGNWRQSSQSKELVLAPKIKLQPNVGPTYGTNLGGTMGYGSMTRTTIVTEPTVMEVNRSMTLTIGADGRFTWNIVKRHAEGERCTRTTTQTKHGRVAAAAGKLVFAISGGSERWQSSCGKSGVGAVPAASESYAMTQRGGSLQLVSGPARFTFTRG